MKSNLRKHAPPNLGNANLESVGAAIRLVTNENDHDMPISPSRRASYWDDRDAFNEPDTPWASSALAKRLRELSEPNMMEHLDTVLKSANATTANSKKFQKALDEAVEMSSPDPNRYEGENEEEAKYLQQLAEFDKLRSKFDESHRDIDITALPHSTSTAALAASTTTNRRVANLELSLPDQTVKFKPSFQLNQPPSSPPPQAPASAISPTTTTTTAATAERKNAFLEPPPSSIAKRNSVHKPQASISSQVSDMSISSSILFTESTSSPEFTNRPVTPSDSDTISSPTTPTAPNSRGTSTEAAPTSTLKAAPSIIFSDLIKNALPGASYRTSKLEQLKKEVNMLQDQCRVLRHNIDKLAPDVTNPYRVEPEQRPVIKQKYLELQQQLEATEKKRYETGIKLTRAWKKESDNSGAGTNFWVHHL